MFLLNKFSQVVVNLFDHTCRKLSDLFCTVLIELVSKQESCYLLLFFVLIFYWHSLVQLSWANIVDLVVQGPLVKVRFLDSCLPSND